MTTTYGGFKADPAFASLPHYGPSFIWNDKRESYASLPGAKQAMDAPNAHVYAGGRQPEQALEDQVKDVAHDFGNDARLPVVSETGFSTATSGGNWWHYGVSERAQSIYLLRTVLKAFALGVPRTYIYHLLDLKPDPGRVDLERQFGIVGTEGDPSAPVPDGWSARPKAAYGSLKELFALTRSSGPDGSPTTLEYALSGAPATLRKVLLARKDGSVDLVLWNQLPVYNDRTFDCNDPRIPPETKPEDRCFVAMLNYSVDQGDAFPADVPITLDLGERARVSTERPHGERSFTLLGTGKTFTVGVGADPVFVRIEPQYAMAVRQDDPAAWLRLGETSGAPVDSAGHGATTEPWALTPTYGRPGAVGDADTAIGVIRDQRTTVRLPTPTNTGTGTSIELWAKPDPATGDFTEFLTTDSPDFRGRMRTYNFAGGNQLGSAYGTTPGAQGEMIFPGFDYGQWHHVVITMAGGTSIAYLNGKKVGETTGGQALDLRAFTVGANSGNGGYKGDVDELAVYRSALSAGRVCAHYRAAGGSC
jgi:hypothetical protein